MESIKWTFKTLADAHIFEREIAPIAEDLMRKEMELSMAAWQLVSPELEQDVMIVEYEGDPEGSDGKLPLELRVLTALRQLRGQAIGGIIGAGNFISVQLPPTGGGNGAESTKNLFVQVEQELRNQDVQPRVVMGSHYVVFRGPLADDEEQRCVVSLNARPEEDRWQTLQASMSDQAVTLGQAVRLQKALCTAQLPEGSVRVDCKQLYWDKTGAPSIKLVISLNVVDISRLGYMVEAAGLPGFLFKKFESAPHLRPFARAGLTSKEGIADYHARLMAGKAQVAHPYWSAACSGNASPQIKRTTKSLNAIPKASRQSRL